MTHGISIIAALQKDDRAIGKDDQLLWRISEDLKRFKELTSHHPIIMGRKTFESIGRPLPNRLNIIISRNKEYTVEGCMTTTSLEDALKIAQDADMGEIFIIGGGEIYTQALPFTDTLYLSVIDAHKEGNIYFPDYSAFTVEVTKEDHPESDPPYTFLILKK